MTKSYFNLTKKDVSILTKTIWRILTKENGILIQEPALQYLLSELTSLEGLDSYLEGMAAYCLKEQSKMKYEFV